jgi:hypothetical protein
MNSTMIEWRDMPVGVASAAISVLLDTAQHAPEYSLRFEAASKLIALSESGYLDQVSAAVERYQNGHATSVGYGDLREILACHSERSEESRIRDSSRASNSDARE